MNNMSTKKIVIIGGERAMEVSLPLVLKIIKSASMIMSGKLLDLSMTTKSRFAAILLLEEWKM